MVLASELRSVPGDLQEDLFEVGISGGEFGAGRQILHGAVGHLVALGHDDHARAHFLDEMQQVRGEDDGSASRARRVIVSRMRLMPMGSSPVSGSSNSRTEASRTRPHAITTFWRIPRDSSPGSSVFLAGQLELGDELARAPLEIGHGVETRHEPQVFGDCQILEEMRLIGHEGQPPLGLDRRRRPNHGRRRRCGPRSASECQRGVRKVVVLPAPLGPIRPTISPRPTSNERSSTAVNVP